MTKRDKRLKVERWKRLKAAAHPPASGSGAARSSPQRIEAEHRDVLQSIQIAIVRTYRDDRTVDDSHARAALEAALSGRDAGGSPAQRIAERLAAMRLLHAHEPDAVWRGGLRHELDALAARSMGRPGDRGYLAFIDGSIP